MSASGTNFGTGGGSIWDNARISGENMSQGFFGLLHNLFNNNKNPYESGFNATKPYFENAQKSQNPFLKQGENALGSQNEWLSKMKNPQDFINHIMSNYSESPWAHNLQTNAVRAGTNAASASGLSGSTPFAQQLQQTAGQISSEDMQKWLQSVLGINTEYGAGLNHQIEGGQHSADILSELNQKQGDIAGGAEYGNQAWNNQNNDSTWANIAKLFGG